MKDVNHPVVVHINTLKGKGYEFAEQNKERWHWHVPFDIATGESSVPDAPDYGDFTADYLLRKMKEDPTVVAITAGTRLWALRQINVSKRENNLLMLV